MNDAAALALSLTLSRRRERGYVVGPLQLPCLPLPLAGEVAAKAAGEGVPADERNAFFPSLSHRRKRESSGASLQGFAA